MSGRDRDELLMIVGLLIAVAGCNHSAPSQPIAAPTSPGSEAVVSAPAATALENEPASSPSDKAAATNESGQGATASPAAQSNPALQVRLQDWSGFAGWLAQQRGKIVVVDVWSTSCEPCVREFPQLVALQARYPDQVLAVGLNCDYVGIKKKPPESYLSKVEKLLTELKAERLVNVLCTTPSDDVFSALDIQSIPAVFVYDQQGQLVHKFDNRTLLGDGEGVSYEKQVFPAVAALVESRGREESP